MTEKLPNILETQVSAKNKKIMAFNLNIEEQQQSEKLPQPTDIVKSGSAEKLLGVDSYNKSRTGDSIATDLLSPCKENQAFESTTNTLKFEAEKFQIGSDDANTTPFEVDKKRLLQSPKEADYSKE